MEEMGVRGKPIRPASADDGDLARVLAEGDAAGLQAMLPRLSANMGSTLTRVVADQAGAEEIHALGRILSSGGLVAAAFETFGLATRSMLLARDKADVYVDMAALKRAVGLSSEADALERVARRLALLPNPKDNLIELDDGSFYVQCVFSDPDGFQHTMAGLPDLPLRNDPLRDPGLTKALYSGPILRERFGAAEDFSFFVLDSEGLPVILAACGVKGEGGLRCYESPLELTVLAPGCPELDQARDLALFQLEQIASWAGCVTINLDFPADAPLPKRLVDRLRDPQAGAILPFRLGWVDLTKDEDAIQKGYRATTRHSIRWGRENVRIVSRPDEIDLPAIYLALHAKANRIPPLSSDMLMEAVRAGQVTAEVGYYQDQPCGLVLTSHHGSTANDMATVRLPDLKEPLTHVLIHQAILNAKAMGRLRFDFGQLWEGGVMGDKMASIARFKLGFASSFAPRLMIQLRKL